MTTDKVIEKLARHRTELEHFSVKAISVFGSVARGEATENSDIDLLVDFNRPVGVFLFVRLRQRLEEMLGAKVDLVTLDALREELRDAVQKEALRAA